MALLKKRSICRCWKTGRKKAFSPIDPIPDFIPILGYMDELVVIPLGVTLAVKMIPQDVMAEARSKAETMESKPKIWVAALVIIAIWLLVLGWILSLVLNR
jgi:hypothetical protein